jgi:cation:H+ antiporter
MFELIHLVAGLALLVLGAELLVRKASQIAARLRVPALVVGLTVVAFGTSAPELAVSTMASLDGQPELALGNVIGSNIYNVLLILGASALVTPLLITAQLVRIDVPIMIGVSVLSLLLALDGSIGRVDGCVLIAGLIAYTTFQVVQGRRSAAAATAAAAGEATVPGSTSSDLLILLFGFALLVGGSRLFLNGAIEVAQSMGVSDLVIGLTIVAAGTSLPETATSIVAALRGERDIAVGNAVGSNVFNIMGVLGVASVVSPIGIGVAPSSIYFDFPVMIAVAFSCLPVFFFNNTIARWQGAVFVTYYVAYVAYLILDAQSHDAIDMLGKVMVYFAFPITAIIFGAIALQRFRILGRRE